jgi:hypothetical protein
VRRPSREARNGRLGYSDTRVRRGDRRRRLLEPCHHGDRVLSYLQTGVIPTPTTARGDGGSPSQGWFGARKLFKASSPAVLLTLCARPEVKGFPPAGGNHLVAERFADSL